MIAADIKAMTEKVTKKYTRQRKREERSSRARSHRAEYMYRTRVNQTDVAWEVIPKAYAKAGDNGRLPAHARQIFYAARDEIQKRTGRPLDSKYFTKTLLPKFINQHPDVAGEWWVVYDARGHLNEPHTDNNVPLGTLEVNDYLEKIGSHSAGKWELHDNKKIEYLTCGPTNRFSAILFIEKEGFNPLFQEVKLAERYDLAIMSTKGQSVVAARRAADEICYVGADVPLLILHDFGKQGFEIAQNLTSVSWAAEEAGRIRYEFKNEINFIDLGLRLADVKKWKLESEKVAFTGSFAPDTTATPEERKFLRSGRRVELNAFTSADFITWLEGKLKQHGIKKVVPDDDTLERAYRRFYQIAHLNENLEDANNEAIEAAEDANLPAGLARKIKKALKDDPTQPWDKFLARIAENDVEAND